MIEVLLDQSYEEDYLMISNIEVILDDKEEAERVQKIADSIKGSFLDPHDRLTDRLAEILGVDQKLIAIDTNDIDFY